MPDTEPMVAASYQALGRLVETWANDPTRIPSEQDGLRKAIETTTGPLPERITTIKVVHEGADTLVVKVPPAEVFNQGKAEVQALGSAGYPLRSEYADEVLQKDTRLSPLDFFYFRVGEYTINQCK